MAIEDHLKQGQTKKMLDVETRDAQDGNRAMKPESPKTIHSGHFMISRVHDPGVDDEDEFEDKTSDSVGYDFMEATRETSKTYRFGPRSTQTLAIDASLTKLFECLTLAYSGKITSPKWKPFRGMHLTIKDKIRLNNIIWREWHLQYLFGRKPAVCQFATPLSDDIHTKPEAVVLEGKYWKRRLDTVTAEYKNWRRYFKDRVSKSPPDSQMQEVASIAELLERVKDSNMLPRPGVQSSTDLLINNDLEDMDFTDNLLFSLKEPFMFPHPREFGQLSCADLIQPGLIQLQPNLDDFMDVDTVHEMIMNTSRSTLSGMLSSSTGTLYSGSSGLSPQPTVTDASSLQLEQQLAALQNYPEPSNLSSSSLEYHLTHPLNNSHTLDNSSSFNNSHTLDNSSSFNNSQSLNTQLDNSSSSIECANMMVDLTATANYDQNQNFGLPSLPVNDNLKTVKSAPAVLSQTRGVPSAATPTQPVVNKGAVNLNQTRVLAAPGKPTTQSNLMTQLIQQELAPQKKDGFVVPMGKPLVPTPRRPRTIAPAPPATTAPAPTSSLQNSYLGQLLTKGTYPGAIIKKEPVSTPSPMLTTTTYQPIRPAVPVRTPPKVTAAVSQTPSSLVSSVSQLRGFSTLPVNVTRVSTPPSFPASVLIAAASEALRTNTNTTKDVFCVSPKPSVGVYGMGSAPTSPATPPQLDCSPQPALSPLSSVSPGMSPGSCERSGEGSCEGDRGRHQEQRRVAHLSSEQKRRCNLKSGFDMLHTLIPALTLNPKVSKAAMLQKTADYCKKLKAERSQMQNEAEILKQEIESLNNAISVVQSQLPETGVPVTRQRVDQMKEMFDTFVRNRTLANWKFWIFSIIIGNLFDTFNNTVSTASMDELCRTVLAWLDQNCSLVSLRPTVLNALRHLSTTTSILTEPSRVKEQATLAVTKGSPSHSRS